MQAEANKGDEDRPDQPAEDDGQGLGEQGQPGGQGWVVCGIEGEVVGQGMKVGGDEIARGVVVSVGSGKEDGIRRSIGGDGEVIGLPSREGVKAKDELAAADGMQRALGDDQRGCGGHRCRKCAG